MKNAWKRVAAGALAIATVAGMTPANLGGLSKLTTGIVAQADGIITYQEGKWNEITKQVDFKDTTIDEYTVVDSTSTSWGGGKTYVVNSEVTIDSRITIDGTANLILCDGAKLTLTNGIRVTEGNTLNIFASGDGTGELIAQTNIHENAAIGGNLQDYAGNIVINGGSVTATGVNGAGIGSGYYGSGGTVTINGGSVNASSPKRGAGIGSGHTGSGGTVTINGGSVNATSFDGAGIGGGLSSSNNTVTINGGSVNATIKKDGYGAGIGGGCQGSGDTVTINGGSVTATIIDNGNGAGIGGGYMGRGGTVTINGGSVTATGYTGAGIGGGKDSNKNTVTINGGSVNATSNQGEGIGKGLNGGSVILILGEKIKLYGGDNKDTAEIITKVDDDYPRFRYMRTEKANPAELTTTPVIADNFGYDGQPHALLKTNGEVADGQGTIKYAVGDVAPTDGWSPDAPTATNAGDYKVWYKIEAANGNYTDVEATEIGTVTVEKANVTLTKTPEAAKTTIGDNTYNDLFFTGESQAIVTAGEAENGTVEYRLFTEEDISYLKTKYGSTFMSYQNGNLNAEEVQDIIDSIYNNSGWNTEIPKATDVGNYYVAWRVIGDENYSDLGYLTQANSGDIFENFIIPVTISDKPTQVKLSNLIDRFNDVKPVLVKAGNVVEAIDDEYTLTGGTYQLYTNKSVAANALVLNGTSNPNYTKLNGITYNYRYTIEVPTIPENGYILSHTNNFQGDVKTTAPSILVVGEDGLEGKPAAELKGDAIYYYGDEPKKSDVEVNPIYGDIVNVEDIYFADEKGNRVDNPEIGKSYTMTAYVTVDKSGVLEENNTDTSDLYLKKEVEFKARPLDLCDVYFVDGETETKLTINNGAVTIPNTTFTYDGTEKAPVIKFVNPANNEIVADTVVTVTGDSKGKNVNDYSFTVTANKNTNYADSVSVNWSIKNAVANITAEALENIVYDAEPLDKTDFTFSATDDEDDLTKAMLADENTSIKVEPARIINDSISTNVNNSVNVINNSISIDNDSNIISTSGVISLLPADKFSDIINAGDTTAKITISNPNFNDVVLTVPATIAKRQFTVTPDADQSMVYGTEEAPEIAVTIENAKDEDNDGIWDTNSGIIPTDELNVNFSDAVQIEDFDYDFFVNNAGIYNYEPSQTYVLNNYTPVIDGNAVFTIEKKTLTPGMFTVAEVDYTYDGTKKAAPTFNFDDGQFGNNTAKLNESDFEVGGTYNAVLNGKYNIEFSANEDGNYDGLVTFNWFIKSDKTYAAVVDIENKTYDGTAVEPTVAYTRNNVITTEVPSDTETTFTYYKIEGDAPTAISAAYISNLTALEGAPANAGTYIVKASTTSSVGYEFDDSYATFTIAQKAIEITPNVTNKNYGDEEAPYSGYTYDEDAIIEGDEVNITGEYAIGDNYAGNGNAGNYAFELGSLEVDNENYYLTIGGYFSVDPQTIDGTNIIVTGRCIAKADGWAYPSDSIKVVTTIDGNETVLEEGKDYEVVSATKTKNLGAFSVQIEGIGNYTGFAAKNVEVITADNISTELAMDIIGTKDGTKATFLLSRNVEPIGEAIESGYIYSKTGADLSGITYDSDKIDDANIKKRSTPVTANNGSVQFSVTDEGEGINIVGFVVYKTEAGTFAQYTPIKTVTYDQAVNETVTSGFKTEIYGVKDGNKVTFRNYRTADKMTILESGFIYSKTGADITNATIASGVDGVDIKRAYTTDPRLIATIQQSITDSGNGISIKGYIKYQTSNGIQYEYSDIITTTYDEASALFIS